MSRFPLCVLVLASIALSCGEESKQDLVERADVGVELARDVREAEAGKGRRSGRNRKPQTKKGKGKKKKGSQKGNRGKGKKTARKGTKVKNGKPKNISGGKGKGGKTKKKKAWRFKKRNRGKHFKNSRGEKKTGKIHRKKERNDVPKQRQVVTDDCLTDSTNARNKKKKGVNHNKQFNRMKGFRDTGDKKKATAGNFTILSTQLADVGGGNKAALTCSGDPSGSGAESLKTAVGILDQCESDITRDCDTSIYPFPSNLDDQGLQDCHDDFVTLIKTINKCEKIQATNITGTCDCYEDIPDPEFNDVQSCNVNWVIADVKAAHVKCLDTFKACNKARKNASPLLYACAQSVAALQTKAVQAQANSVAIAAANAAVTKVSSSRRRTRAAPTTCAELITETNVLADLAKAGPTDSAVEDKAKEITDAASSITCTEEEKKELKEAADALDEAATELNKVVAALIAAIEESTGTEVEVETLTAPPVVTPAAAARRNRLVRNILAGLNN